MNTDDWASRAEGFIDTDNRASRAEGFMNWPKDLQKPKIPKKQDDRQANSQSNKQSNSQIKTKVLGQLKIVKIREPKACLAYSSVLSKNEGPWSTKDSQNPRAEGLLSL